MLRRTAPVLVCLMASAPWACSSSSPECSVGSDCASGVCESSGRCAPVSGTQTDSGTTILPDGAVVASDGAILSADSGSGGGDGSQSRDDSSNAGDAPSMTADTGSPGPGVDGGLCVPNNDGTITRDEVPMQAGLHANFEFAENVTVDSAGTMNANGTYAWDLTGPYSGDHTALVTTNDPTGQWFSSRFPGATYTTTLSDSSNLLGVFEASQTALSLIGIASPTSGNTQTELSYSPPAQFLGVPMTLGTTWSSNSDVTGTAEGLVSNYFEAYASKVDAQGTLKTPYGTFNVLRVQTTLTRTVGGVATITRSFAWVAECFGTIASLTSQSDETQTNFTNAAQVMRLTP
jgi:hypothetical protein